jgi:hypothetical protein
MATIITNEYNWRTQCDFSYSPDLTTTTAAPFTEFYQSNIVTDGTVVGTIPSTPWSLTVDLVAKGTSTVVVSGNTYTYSQALSILQAIFAQERTAQLNSSTPSTDATTKS